MLLTLTWCHRWLSDAQASERWTALRPGTRAAERPRWEHNAHINTETFQVRAEKLRGKKRAIMLMPAFLKVRAPPPADKAEEWVPPRPPPAVDNPVRGPCFGKVVKLANVKGKRWVAGGYENRNYHGKGVYIGRLQQDRLGNVCEFF